MKLLISLVVFSMAANAAAQSLPDGRGKDVFESVCSLCHDPTAVMGKQFTKDQWELKIIEMLQEEPDVTVEERETILEYLSAHFKPGGKIYINKASAKDLQAAMDFTASEAEAVVRIRDQRGAFKTIDDVKKVPNLDTAKIDAKKDLLVF